MKRKKLWLIAVAVLMALSCEQNESVVRELRSEADLSGLTLSTSAGNFYDNKYSGREDITMFRVNTEADGIQAVRQGIADVHVTDEVAFTPQMRRDLGIKLAFRITHAELSGETALDFMVEKMETTPLSDEQRRTLAGKCKQVVEEPTARGFRVKLII